MGEAKRSEAEREAERDARLDRIERMIAELVERSRPKSRVRRQIERARAQLSALHKPTDLDRAAARKALARYR